MSDFVIKDYSPDLYPGLMKLWSETALGGAERGDNRETIERSLSMGGRLLIMINKANDHVIGSSWMTFDGRRIHLHHFGMLPAYQGKGLSHQLMLQSLKHVKKEGHQVKLEVHKTNHKATRLYKKYGFNYLGDYDVYIIRDIDAI